MTRILNTRGPAPDPPPKKQQITRQRRERMNRDAVYLAIRDVYLEENPACVVCGIPATQVHHVVRGTAGRSRSLLNSDSWLGVCGGCHELVELLTAEQQIKLKQKCVRKTIERLKGIG